MQGRAKEGELEETTTRRNPGIGTQATRREDETPA